MDDGIAPASDRSPTPVNPRLDWRFLLTDPALRRMELVGPPLSGAPDGDLTRALASLPVGSDRPTSPEHRPGRVLVVPDPTADASAIAALVGPDDVLYVEQRRGRSRFIPNRRPRAASAASLRGAGLAAEAYWVWPSFEACQEIAPLADSGALRIALSRRSSRLGARLRAAIGRALVGLGLFERVVPTVAIVARRAGDAEAGSPSIATGGRLGFVVDHLERERERLDLAAHGIPGRASGVLITPRFGASQHVVVLVSAAGEARARLVAKVHRRPAPSAALSREAANLAALTTLGLPAGAVPALIAFEDVCAHPVLVETALPGRAVDPTEVRRNRQVVIREVERLLLGLVRPPPAGWDDRRFTRQVEAPLASLARALRSSSADLARVDAASSCLLVLERADLPRAFEHGDLAHPNLLWRADGGVAALDWELGEPDGLPLQDFTFFLAHVGFALSRPRADDEYAEAARRAFLAPDRWASPILRRHARRAGLDQALVGPLVLATWSRYLARHAARSPGGLPAGRFLAIWRVLVDEQRALAT